MREVAVKAQELDIRVGVGVPPNDFGVVFVSTDAKGNPGELNRTVTRALGMTTRPTKKELEGRGFSIQSSLKTGILAWVVTVSPQADTRDLLSENLKNALFSAILETDARREQDYSVPHSIWLPIMGIGSGALSWLDSARLTLDVLLETVELLDGWQVTIALPDDVDPRTAQDINDLVGHALRDQTHGSTTPVESLQQYLKHLKEDIDFVDGLLGPQTLRALANHLNATEAERLQKVGLRETLAHVFPYLDAETVMMIESGWPGSVPLGPLEAQSSEAGSEVEKDDPPAEDPSPEIPPADEDSADKDPPDPTGPTDMTGGYHSDHAVRDPADDQLGRLAIADAIAENVLHVWPSHRDPKHARPLVVHLSGRWGSGKSSILHFLRHRLENDHTFDQNLPGHIGGQTARGWTVVDFNAWQMQEAGPAWWSLGNALVDQAATRLPDRAGARIKWQDRRWQFWKLNSPILPVIAIALTVICGSILIDLLTLGTADAPFTKIETKTVETLPVTDTTTTTRTTVTQETTGTKPPDKSQPFWQPILAVVTFVGALGTLLTFMRRFSRNSSETAETLRQLRSDPDESLKARFKTTVEAIGTPVAIFIDDLDRCDAPYIIELLQGLQTAYRDVPVLYVVAADREWIVSAYNQQFEGFQPEISRPGQPLGYLFVKKIFQLNVNVPDLVPAQASSLTEDLLGGTDEAETGPPPEVLKEQDLKDIAAAETLEDLSQLSVRIGQAGRSNSVAPELFAKVREQAAQEELAHALLGYTDLFDNNPRSIKRLVNALTFRTGYMLMGGLSLPFDVVVRWTILDLRFPYTAARLSEFPDKVQPDKRQLGTGDKDGPDSAYFHDPVIDTILTGLSADSIRAVRALG